MAAEIEQTSVEPTLEVVKSSEEVEEHFEPKGAFTFVLIVLVGYALYFAFIYFQVFFERGGS